MSRWKSTLLAACLASGCGGAPVRYVAPDYRSRCPPRVALLPFENESVDLVGPEMLRRMVQARLMEHGYEALPLELVDEKLRGLGGGEAGALARLEPGRVAKALEVGGLFYGTVEEFTMQNVGFVARRSVRLRVRFVEAPGGERLWEDTGKGSTGTLTLDKKAAQRIFLEGLLERGVESLFRTPLMPESKAAVQDLFSRLPRR
ncbi:MAG: DUF799 family lipoprotein [Elusimicrobia bacterium]|nr:DUF799 family lipoprotein [Elusimicrobiota bacterium]